MSAARGLALALGIPAIGISRFEVLRLHASPTYEGPLVVSLPTGRRGADAILSFYDGGVPQAAPYETMIFKRDGQIWTETEHPTYPEGTHILGHEPAALNWILAEAAGRAFSYDGAVIADEDLAVALAHGAAKKGIAEPARTRPAPLYLRPPDAAPPRDAPPVILP